MSAPLDMRVRVGDLELRNPILLASGTCGYGTELLPFLDMNSIGGFVTKGISLKPRAGNPPPRIVETPAGMLNAIGLQNVGLDNFLSEKLPAIRKLPLACIVNIYGNTFEEYLQLAEGLGDHSDVHAIEVNLSCPNVKQGGVEFGQDPVVLKRLISQIRERVRCPLLVKLSPNVADVQPFVSAAEEGGADATSLINTLRGMEINIHQKKPVLGNISGGLSGPAIRPVALYQVFRAAQVAKEPVVGMGGIETWEDIIRFLLAGATAVQVGTALFRNPGAPQVMLDGLRTFLTDQKITDINDLVGSLEFPG